MGRAAFVSVRPALLLCNLTADPASLSIFWKGVDRFTWVAWLFYQGAASLGQSPWATLFQKMFERLSANPHCTSFA
jgi:hypothetical protein